MFVQLITGRARDGDGLRRQWTAWHRDEAPDRGWLGSTGGITPGGHFLAALRFESEVAARPHHDWWAGAEAMVDGYRLEGSADVTVLREGSDEAGFVQMMRARVADRRRFEKTESSVGDLFMRHRPDFLGGYRVWLPDGTVQAVDYFTTEADARAAEQREPPPELQAGFEAWMAELGDVSWFDLPDPWLSSP